MQGMADLFAEPLVKTFQGIKGSQSGRIYAVLEMKGEVEAFETGDHESYPFAIRSTSGQTPIVHVLKNSNLLPQTHSRMQALSQTDSLKQK